MSGIPQYPNLTAAAPNSTGLLYPGLQARAEGQYIPGVSQPYGYSEGGYRLTSPALDQQRADLERQIFLNDAATLQNQYGYTQKRGDLNISMPDGYSPNVNYSGMDVSGGYPSGSSKGSRTGLTPAQIGRALANYDNGKYKGDPGALYADAMELSANASAVADRSYAEATGSSTGGTSQSSSGNSNVRPDVVSRVQNLRAAMQERIQNAPPVSYPSYSGNPAGGYTNVTQLGPVNAGPVTISQNTPYDMGWGTQSSYDPNTGLSKWSTSGLTNGEMYYDNLYADRFSDEAARKQAQAASLAATQQNRAAGFARQDLINLAVDAMVANGMDKSMARVQARNYSDDELASYMQQVESDAANANQDAQLNALLEQFANPNYGSVQTPLPSYGGQGSQQQTPTYTLEQQNADIQAAINNPNLSNTERNQAISNAQQAYVASQAAQRQQSSSGGGSVEQINAQYNQAVQQQQQQAAQQQQQELAQQFQQAMDQANAANQARYDDIIAGYQQNQQQISDYLTNQGQQQQEDIGRQYDRFGAQNEQDLISRGLGNTTVRTSTQRGIEEDRGRALRNSQEQIDRQRLQYETAAQQGLLNFMERRTDAGPNYGDLANLAQGLGSAGGGTGGGSGTGSATSPTTGTGAVPSYTNPANGQQTGSGYNPIFNTGQQQQQPQPQPEVITYGQASNPAGGGPATQVAESNYNYGMGATGTYGMQADGSYITPPDQRNVAGQGANINMQAGPGGPVGGANISSGASVTNVNPWTNPVEANKAGQIDPRQRSINMRSSGVAGIPSYNQQSTIKQGSYSSTQGPGTGTKTIIAGNAGWTNEQAQAARARLRTQYGSSYQG